MSDDRFSLRQRNGEDYWFVTVPIPGTENQVVETDVAGTEKEATAAATELVDKVHESPKYYLGEEE